MILNLFSEHLSADGKVMSSLTPVLCCLLCTWLLCNHIVCIDWCGLYVCISICWVYIFCDHFCGYFCRCIMWLKAISTLCVSVCGLQRHVSEPCVWAILWTSHSAAEGGAAFTKPGGEAGFLYQHLQCLSHPWVPAPWGPHQHVAKIQSRITQMHSYTVLYCFPKITESFIISKLVSVMLYINTETLSKIVCTINHMVISYDLFYYIYLSKQGLMSLT